MKRLLLIAALLAWLCGALSAQNKTSKHSLDVMTRSIFERLEKRDLKSGILLQQAAVFVNPFRYDGTALNDANCMDANNFGKLFGQFRVASTGKSVLPEPEIYMSDLRRLRETPDTIPLALMAMQYDYIWNGAIEAGLLGWDADQKLIDLPRRGASPYRQDTSFAFAAMLQESKSSHVVFQLPSKLIFNNLGWDINGMQIDFGDGQGWKFVQPDECISIDYGKPGKKPLQIKFQQDNREWRAHSFVQVPEKKAPFAFLGEYAGTPDEVVPLGGVTINMFYDCPDHKLRKPLIVIEGIGGAFTDFNRMLTLLGSTTSSGTLLKDFLDNEGYDLIWVDWTDSNASIQDNAAALQGAIEWINRRKHADGSSETNAMIGCSMGGLVGKYCLLSMHNAQGLTSEVERFFTYDSPLKGGNYPVGIQLFIKDILSLSDVNISDPSLDAALVMLDGDAATQMLRQKAEIDQNGNLTLTSAGFDAFQADMDALEAIRPLTGFTRHIALSNGAGNGVGQENIPDPIAIELYLGIDGIDSEPTPWWQYDIDVAIKGYVAGASTTLLYERTITIVPIIGQSSIYEYVSYTHPTALALDVAPGGFSNIALGQIKSALENALPNVPNQLGWYLLVNLDNFCFIPTVSSVGLPITAPLNGPPSGGGIPASRFSMSMDNSVVSPISNNPETNQDHVSMNVRIADILVDELKAQTNLQAVGPILAGGQTYNFGKTNVATSSGILSTPRTISQDLNIQNGGALWINRDGRIAYTNNVANPLNNIAHSFGVSVPGSKCEEDLHVVVTVENGGKLLVGQLDNGVLNTGQLVFGENSELIVNGLEGMKIDKKSSLHIADGAKMTIKTGALVTALDQSHMTVENGSDLVIDGGGRLELNWGAECIVRNGGRLIVQPGAILQINHPGTNVTVHSGGEIIIKPGAFVRLWDGSQDDGNSFLKIAGGGKMRVEGEFNLSGNGYIWFKGSPGGGSLPIYEDLRPEVKYVGFSKTCRLFFLDYAGFGVTNKSLRLENMEIVCAGTGVYAQNGNVRMYNVNIGGNANIALSVDGGNFLHVNNTDFDGCSIGMEVMNHLGILGGFPRIENSRFKNCWQGLAMYNGRYLNILGTDFSACSGQALWLENISSYVGFTNSTVTGVGGFGDVSPGAAMQDLLENNFADGIHLDNVSRFRMSGGEISNCATGIFVPAFSKSNVILTNKATVKSNRIGVHVQNGFREMSGGTVANYGMVMMDCARLLDNYLGIAGINVLLQIDAFSNSGTKNPAFVRSNHFRITTDGNFARKLFFVCYDGTQYNPAVISAGGNFWENTNDEPHPSWRLFNSTINTPPPAGCFVVNSPNNVALLRIPVVLEMPSTCPIPPDVPDPGGSGNFACPPPPNSGINGKLHEQFFKGYKQFTIDAEGTGEFNASNALFKPLSDISDVFANAMTGDCKSFVLASQAFVPGNPTPLDGEGDNRSVSTTNAQAYLFASPNPTNGLLNVVFPDESCSLRAFDAFGRLVLETQASGGTAQLDASTWPVGIYIIEAIGADFREQVKVSVQR